MLAVVQNKEIFHEIFLNHFKKKKTEIANSITQLFPFLERLRDHSFITNKTYNDSQEACRNLVAVRRVVPHILCDLEKQFDGSLLQALFRKEHLKEHPDLTQNQRSFENGNPFAPLFQGRGLLFIHHVPGSELGSVL
ncbi:nuclear body protein SP140-like protein [Choloepus didactylus]|uniref:nuclear body protein SP140-like protein n=1 Tax=Choloepus didactylus TaxID=27675 RepID=UPI0018A07CA9|nr:nuclear body protein SP140-like protein [Choloepus didactylus]XP_037706577.1 nuclear body protein SP140-like protein [Choloepus didactylus]